MTIIKQLEAQSVNDSLELDAVKDALYKSELSNGEQVTNLLTENQRHNNQNLRLEKLCRKLNKKLRSAEKKAAESSSNSPMHVSHSMGNLEKSGSLYSLDQNGESGSTHSGSLDDNLLDEQPPTQYGGLYGNKEISELSRKPNVPRQGIVN